MRMDAGPRIRAMPHQQPHHRRCRIDHGVMQRSPLVAIGPLHIDEIRPLPQQRLDARQIVRPRRLDELPAADTIDMRLQPRPVVEPIRPRQDALRVMQREVLQRRIAIVRLHLGDGRRVASAYGIEQFLGLATKLMEIGSFGKRSRRTGDTRHDEPLPG